MSTSWRWAISLGVAGLILTACGSSASPRNATTLEDASITVGSRTVASLAMGRFASKPNTFWQLLTRDGSSPWRLVTPPGVATNGGIETSMPTSSEIVAAVLPSELLKFTALARSNDAGRTWSPGVVEGRLDATPDAIAASSGSPSLALLAGSKGEVLVAPRSLSHWTPLVLHSVISASTSRCGLTYSGVAVGPSGTVLLAGEDCGSGVVPIVDLVGRGWRLVGPSLGAMGSLDVLRLVGTPTGAACLVEGRIGSQATLFEMASTDRFKSWRVSRLALAKGAIVSTSISTGGAASVLVSEPGGTREAYATKGQGSPWLGLPPLPNGAALVTAPNVGTVQLLAVDQSELTVYVPLAGGWRAVQRMKVPIVYGSSS